MSTPQSIALAPPHLRIRPAALATAFGVLVAITVSIVILALTGASHAAATSPVTASAATSSSVPQVQYLGPRQMSAAANAQNSINVVHYTCLGAARNCLR